MMHVTWARFDREISWGLNEFELCLDEKLEVRPGNENWSMYFCTLSGSLLSQQ